MCIGRKVTSDASDVFTLPEKRTKIVETSRNTQPLEHLKLTNNPEEIKYSEDILAVSTYFTKVVLFQIGEYHRAFQNSTFFKILFHTTQPAHLITALAVISIAYLMLPSKTQATNISPLWTLLYLGSFSAHFGAQIWMTFISGLALYFSLPRHTFGNVQQILFPKYFLLNATLSLITLAIFLRAKNSELSSVETAIQASGMAICFLTELVIRLYLTPPLLSLISVKNEIEKEAGIGMEIGKLNPGRLAHCPHYLKIHKNFRKVHMSIAIGNIVTMACTMLHLYYLSRKLCVLSL